MKNIPSFVVALVIPVSACGQGTLLFNNRDLGHGIDAPVSRPDGLGAGAGFTAQLFIVSGGSFAQALTSTAPFRTNSLVAAYYVQPPMETIVVPGIPGGTSVTVRMVAYNGADFNSSTIRGQSPDFTITLGNFKDGQQPPTVPADLIGLQGFTMSDSTPSTPPVIVFQNPVLISGASFQMSGQGGINQSVRIESSTDFGTWTALTTLIATNGVFQFADTNLTDRVRFYRAAALP